MRAPFQHQTCTTDPHVTAASNEPGFTLLPTLPWLQEELHGPERSPGRFEKVHGMWKEGQTTWEEYRNVVRACRDATRKAKAHLELKLARDVKNNRKGFFNYISSKRKTRDNVGPLLNEAGVLVMEDSEKAELLKAFFASVFSAKAGPQESQAPEV